MNITNIQLKAANFPGAAAFGTVTFDDIFDIQVRIAKGGASGVFVAWPSYHDKKDDKWKSITFIKDKDVRNEWETEIMAKFNDEIGITPSTPKEEEPPPPTETKKPARKVNFTM
jgi:DNA-binding cell septation regulator SpoVG